MNVQLFANGPVTRVSGPVDVTQTTVTVTDAAGFPASGDFTIMVDYEVMLVTAVAGAAWTVARGQEGTTASLHVDQSYVTMPLTKAALERLHVVSKAGVAVGDRRTLNFVDTGTVTWTVADNAGRVDVSAAAAGGGGGGYEFPPAAAVPAAADFTWLNQGSASATDYDNGVGLWDDAHNSQNMRVLLATTALPAVPWRVTARIEGLNYWANIANDFGLLIYDTAADDFETLSRSQEKYKLLRGTAGPTGAVTVAGENPLAQHCLDVKWFRIEQHSSKRWFKISLDGYNWVTVQVYWDYLAPVASPNRAGFYANANNNWGVPLSVSCGYFKVESIT